MRVPEGVGEGEAEVTLFFEADVQVAKRTIRVPVRAVKPRG